MVHVMEYSGSRIDSSLYMCYTYKERQSIKHFEIMNISCVTRMQCVPKGLFPVGLPVKILKALLPSSILAT